jgi:hypothetical protein
MLKPLLYIDSIDWTTIAETDLLDHGIGDTLTA